MLRIQIVMDFKNGKSIGSNSRGETNSTLRCRLLIGCGWRRRDGGGTAAWYPLARSTRAPARPSALGVFMTEKPTETSASRVWAILQLVCLFHPSVFLLFTAIILLPIGIFTCGPLENILNDYLFSD